MYKMHEKDSEDSVYKLHEGWEMEEDGRWEAGIGSIAGSLTSFPSESWGWRAQINPHSPAELDALFVVTRFQLPSCIEYLNTAW